ncbi:hypothetical protein IWX92DRAFT_402214 [Phyllosticta citricarpa]
MRNHASNWHSKPSRARHELTGPPSHQHATMVGGGPRSRVHLGRGTRLALRLTTRYQGGRGALLASLPDHFPFFDMGGRGRPCWHHSCRGPVSSFQSKPLANGFFPISGVVDLESPNLVRGGRNSAPPVLAEVDGKSVSWINTYGGSPAPEPHVATPVPVFIRPFPRPRPRKSVDNPKSDIVAIGRPDNPPSSPHSHVHPDWPEPCYPSCYGHRQSSLSALSKTIPSDTCEVWDRTSCYNSGSAALLQGPNNKENSRNDQASNQRRDDNDTAAAPAIDDVGPAAVPLVELLLGQQRVVVAAAVLRVGHAPARVDERGGRGGGRAARRRGEAFADPVGRGRLVERERAAARWRRWWVELLELHALPVFGLVGGGGGGRGLLRGDLWLDIDLMGVLESSGRNKLAILCVGRGLSWEKRLLMNGMRGLMVLSPGFAEEGELIVTACGRGPPGACPTPPFSTRCPATPVPHLHGLQICILPFSVLADALLQLALKKGSMMRAVACSLHVRSNIATVCSHSSSSVRCRQRSTITKVNGDGSFPGISTCRPNGGACLEGMGWVSGPVAGTLHASSRPPLPSSMTPQPLPPSFNNSNHRTSTPPPSSNGLPLAALLALQSSDHRMRLGTLSTVLATGREDAGKYHGDPADKIIRDWLVQAVTLAIGQRLYGSSSLNEDVHSCVDFIDIPYGGPLAPYKEKLLCTAFCESHVAGLLPMLGGWGERALVPCPALAASPFSSTSPAFTSPPV